MYQPEEEQQLAHWARELLHPDYEEELSSRIERLRAVINYADIKYYLEDNPVFADQEYDRLFRQLKDIEQQYPELITPDSPTQRIAEGLSERFPAVAHLVPMLSLENSYNANDLREWDRRCRTLAGTEPISYTVEPKYDGAGISLIYENNYLTRGATRGDGIQGEDITANIRQIRSIPLSAPLHTKNVTGMEIRGEVLIPKDIFIKYNEGRVADGLPPLANPRNAASGTLRMLDPKEVGKRGLRAILYHVSHLSLQDNRTEPQVFQTHYDTLKWLDECGFPTPIRDMKKCGNIDEVINCCLAAEAQRDQLPFEIDGMVVKVNHLALQEQLGMTNHHPRWAIAYKFKARQATTRLAKVTFQVGRTGSITPVAKIDPVAIGGVTVTSVSLFNEEVIRAKDFRIGDQVLVERAGDVIPYLVKPLSDLRTGEETPIVFPDRCPVCQEPLFQPEGEAAWRCININCPAQTVEHIIHFASKDAMDIRNLGAANIRRFYGLGLLRNIADVYRLDFNKISTLDKFGVRSVHNLKSAIETAKKQPLHRLIFGLGIRYVGITTAKTLASAIHHILDLSAWSQEQLCSLEDVGPKVASSVFRFFQNQEHIDLLKELEASGVNVVREPDSGNDEGPFQGKTFLFTGTLAHIKRSEAEAMVEEKGGKVLSGVSSKLTYLIVGSEAGAKLEKAKRLGTVKILDESAFLTLINTEK